MGVAEAVRWAINVVAVRRSTEYAFTPGVSRFRVNQPERRASIGARQAEYRLSSVRRARLTFSRISDALAIQMKGLGLWFCFVDVLTDGHDEFSGVMKDAAP